MGLAGIFGPLVSVAETSIAASIPDLFPAEEMAMSGAVWRRRREFSIGRACARQAMNGIGFDDMAIPMGADRAPIWPSGVTGSISHSPARCIAAVARLADGVRAIGVDLEEAVPLEEELAEEICTPIERAWLANQQPSLRGLLRMAIFCAKESAYKCQYPLSRTVFGFDTIRIELNLAQSGFAAFFEMDIAPFKRGERLNGHIGFHQGHLVSGVLLC